MTGKKPSPMPEKRRGEMTERNILITSLNSMENRTERRYDNKNMRGGRPDRSADNGTGSGDADNK